MKKILLTGARGQLGCCLRDILDRRPDIEYVATDVVASDAEGVLALDLTDAEAVSRMTEDGFDFIVNCAAYTAVDKAEDQPELCRAVNSDAVGNIGEAATRTGVKVIHVSTDYVFGGDGCRPYRTTDPVNPRSVYGSTKLEGEWRLIKAMGEGYAIIRTAWLYSPYGNNFVKTMMRLGNERESLNVVADQIGTPTYAPDLAAAIVKMIDADLPESGIFHFTDEGVASWYDFAVAIMEMAGITGCNVHPCESEEYPTKATRPFYSVLSKKKIRDQYGVVTPYWRDSLKNCIKVLSNGIID